MLDQEWPRTGNDGDVETEQQSAQCRGGRQKYHIANIDVGLHARASPGSPEFTLFPVILFVSLVTRNPPPNGKRRASRQPLRASCLTTADPSSCISRPGGVRTPTTEVLP